MDLSPDWALEAMAGSTSVKTAGPRLRSARDKPVASGSLSESKESNDGNESPSPLLEPMTVSYSMHRRCQPGRSP
jgi:hypothetical protein